ncbi:MAG: 4-alpha-glucanotransferase [Frankiaceae bacterium]
MDRLRELAAAHGVATHYEDQAHQRVEVAPDAIRKVLAALGVDPASIGDSVVPPAQDGGHADLPPTVVMTLGHPPQLPSGSFTVELEAGGTLATGAEGLADLPLGWHTLRRGDQTATLVVAPEQAPLPPRAWGWMIQLYAVRSVSSWGLGDLADLAELARWSGSELGAGLLLVNPMHAVAPVLPIEPSPYYPTSRRFVNPIYLRVENTPEYAAAPADVRAEVDALGAPLRSGNRSERLERDPVWTAKMAALATLWPYARRDVLIDYRRRTPGIEEYALFAALAERHGISWRSWPAELHDPHGPAARVAREELRDRVDFTAWLQLLCAEQLAAAQQAATAAGMPIGIVHDLAVGVDPAGADSWALQDVLAGAATAGAPPDMFNQQGQNWQLAPWHPRRLAEVGYAPYRDLLRSLLGAGGGVRIDHILGLFRLWWVPAGSSAAEGSFVAYDDEALLAILALEAHRAGASVVGEDLGTVERRVSTALVQRAILGSAVLWFERYADPVTNADGPRKRTGDWRELALASISTHDLPTAAGFLAGEHVRIRDELGQLTRPVAEERAQAERDRMELLELLADEGLLGDGSDPVLAMHQFLARTPSRLVVAQLADAVGDLRQPNLPGTTDEYPNWRLPLADDEGPVTLEDLQHSVRVRQIAAALGGARSDPARPIPSLP